MSKSSAMYPYASIAIDSEPLDKATRLLAGIDGGISKALANTMTRVAQSVRTNSSREIAKVYDISAKNLRLEDNSKISYDRSEDGSITAYIRYSGFKIPLYRYGGTTPKTDIRDVSIKYGIMIKNQWKLTHPSVPVRAHQLKSTAPSQLTDAFIGQMRSGHIGIFERSGDSSLPIKEKMGSSIPTMLSNEETMSRLSQIANETFTKRMEHEVTRILNGFGR